MSTHNDKLRINRPTVAYEVIDGEVVIINFDNGNYHSLEGVGTAVWNALERGELPAAIVDQLAERHDVDRVELTGAVDGFLGELLAQGLLVPGEVKGAGEPSSEALPEPAGGAAYAPPKLNTYRDMQEFLLLDPIHDVDEDGWPILPDEAPQ